MNIMRSVVGSLIVLLLFTACGKSGGPLMPTASGAPFELLVVMNKEMWKRDAGEALREVLESEVPGLPQVESNFRLSIVDDTNFTNLVRPVRNILKVDISEIYSRGSMIYARDVHSAGQMILTLRAENEAQFAEYVRANEESIVRFFVHAELNRSVKQFQTKYNSALLDSTRKLFNEAEVKIPNEMSHSRVAEDFIWATNNSAKGRMDVVVYSVPYHNVNDFSAARLVAVRDSVMRINIKGSKETMFMQTETKHAPVECDTIGVNGKFTVRMRGLWQMEGDIMGGPFVSHTRLDEESQRIVTVEGFVFAPGTSKRNLIRRMEAVLYTFRLKDELKRSSEIELMEKQAE